MSMCVMQALESLIDKTFGFFFLHHLSLMLFHDLVEVLLHELEHKVQIIVDSYHLLQLHNVLVVQLPQ